jgi:hypothetical protein
VIFVGMPRCSCVSALREFLELGNCRDILSNSQTVQYTLTLLDAKTEQQRQNHLLSP